ncbi:MAG: multidrug effflux MFS transporter [Paracoccaceae bacterium]
MPNNSKPIFLNRTTPPHILTLVIISGMSAMVLNMFLPSLPTMTAYFDTEYRIMQLSVALYLGAVAALQTIIGPLSDRYGRRPILLAGFVIFLLSTIGCLLAQSAEMFLVFRVIQATVGVAMVLSRAIARDMFDQSQAASMIGYITMGMAIIPMVSPALGGMLVENFGWQANFWVFFAVGLLVLLLIWADVGETNNHRSTSFRQQFADYPELLLSPRFWGYSMAAAFSSGAFFAYLGGGPFVGSIVYDLPPSTMGLFFGAPALGYVVGNFISGRFSTRVGINLMVFYGSLLLMVGLAISLLISLLGFGSVYTFFGFMIFVGLGNGMVLPNATAGMLSVRPHLAGTASGLGGAIMMGGGAGLSVLAGSVLSEETGPFPLLWLMFAVGVLSTASILYVMKRDKSLGIA